MHFRIKFLLFNDFPSYIDEVMLWRFLDTTMIGRCVDTLMLWGGVDIVMLLRCVDTEMLWRFVDTILFGDLSTH